MADKSPEDEKGTESLSATAMFLRSFAPAPQKADVPAEQPPPTAAAVAPQSDAGEFTRMFRPVLPPESVSVTPAAPAPTPPAPAPQSAGGDFTRAFVVPSPAAEQLPPLQVPPARAKGFSTPGVSDSASAEGSFTRIFRSESQQAPQSRSSEPSGKEPITFPPSNAASPPPEPSFLPKPQAVAPQTSGITEMFRALAPESEKSPLDAAYKPESATTPRPYTEPVRLAVADRPANVSPAGGGVTELLSRLTAETPLMPSAPSTLPPQRPEVQPEIAVDPPPATKPGEFTRILQAAEIQAALASTPPPPSPVAASGSAAPAPPLSIKLPPIPVPVVPAAPATVAPLPLASPALPKLKVNPPVLPVAPKSKLQEMVPLLLVANGFLMLILILLVAMALHRK